MAKSFLTWSEDLILTGSRINAVFFVSTVKMACQHDYRSDGICTSRLALSITLIIAVEKSSLLNLMAFYEIEI